MYYKRLNVLSSIIYYALLLHQDCACATSAHCQKRTAPNAHKHRVKVIAREIVRAHHTETAYIVLERMAATTVATIPSPSAKHKV